MGALVSIISRRGENVVPEAIKMLNILRHRGMDLCGISTDSATFTARGLRDLVSLLGDTRSSVVLGYGFNPTSLGDIPQPIEIDKYRMAFDGVIFSPHPGISGISNMIRRFDNAREAAESMIRAADGAFAFTILENDKIFAGRDSMGAKPLYIGVDKRFYALASERKALWLLGIEDDHVRSIPPGSLIEISGNSPVIHVIKTLERTGIKLIGEEETLQELYRLLLEAVRERVTGLRGISVAFSGGLDSALIAVLAAEAGANVLLISVGLEGFEETRHAEKVADEVGLPLRMETYTIEDVKETLPKVLWLIEEANALKASIYIPLFWAAQVSSRMNLRIMLSGQGSDELFAGYNKYLRYLNELEHILYEDMLSLHETSLEPEEKTCSFHGVEVRFPYVDYDLASFALSLPATLKIMSANDPLRKRILRKLAERMGLPPWVCFRPKKAIQYGTGVSKALNRIARRKGLKIHDFINQVFQEIEWFDGWGQQ